MTTIPKTICMPEHATAHRRLHEALTAWARIVEQIACRTVYPEEAFLAEIAQEAGLCHFVAVYGEHQNWNPHMPTYCPSRLMLTTFHVNFDYSGAPFNLPEKSTGSHADDCEIAWNHYKQEAKLGTSHLNPNRIAFVREFLAGAYSPAGLFPSED